MKITSRLSLIAVSSLLALTACSSSDSDGGDTPDSPGSESAGDTGTDDTTDDGSGDRSASEALDAAVDATLATRRFSVEYDAALDIDGQDLSLSADGSVDYDATVADLELDVEQQGATQQVAIIADGETAWVSATGGSVPAFPDGKTYVSGDASVLSSDDTFAPEDLLGVLYVLRGADDAEAGDTEEVDGVEATTYTTTIAYDDAVEAAGDDAEAFQTAFSLTGDADQADLAIEVAVGPDDVVRSFSLDIEAGDVPVDGTYDLELTDVGADVEVPEAPDADDVATGPDADALFTQLLASS